jgi:GTPase
MLSSAYPDYVPMVVNSNMDSVVMSRLMADEHLIPIFILSSVTGRCYEQLTSFLSLLPSLHQEAEQHEHTEFVVFEKFKIEGKIIVGGTVLKGVVQVGRILHLGPDLFGRFLPTEVTSIECRRVPTKLAVAGQTCSVGLRMLILDKELAIRKGMVLVDSRLNPRAFREFICRLDLYGEQPEVSFNEKYKPVVNTITSRQSCLIIMTEEEAEPLPRRKTRSTSKEKRRCKEERRDKKSVDMLIPKGFFMKRKKKLHPKKIARRGESFQLRLKFEYWN